MSNNLSTKLAKAVNQSVAQNGNRQESMDPYDLFHDIRSQFRLTPEEEVAVKEVETGQGRTTLAIDIKTYDTRHIAVRIYIGDDYNPAAIVKDILGVTGHEIYQNQYTNTFLVNISDPYKDGDGTYVADCVVASHLDFAQAYEICSSTMNDHQLKLGKGVHDPDAIIDRAARIAFEKTITDLSMNGMILQVLPANLTDVEAKIATQSEGIRSPTGSSFAFTMP